MKTLIILAVLFVIMLSGCGFTPASMRTKIEKDCDKYTGACATTLSWHQVYRIDAITPDGFWIDAQRIYGQKGATLVVRYTSKRDSRYSSWLFIDRLYLIIDGERIRLDSNDDSRRVLRGGVMETVIFNIDMNLLNKMATAENIRYSIRGSRGSNEGEFSQESLEWFKKFREAVATKDDYIDQMIRR